MASPTARGQIAAQRGRRHNHPRVPASKAVARPQPQNHQDARTFELSQLQRRFGCTPTPSPNSETNGTKFTLNLKPSDPDFVYAIDVLKLRLTVPEYYKEDGEGDLSGVSIEVLNTEIPLGYRVNVERGFDVLVDEAVKRHSSSTLMDLMKSLDKGLERMLSGEKAETLKIIPNYSPAISLPPPPPQPTQLPAQAPVEHQKMVIVTVPTPPPPTSEQRAAARARRDQETRQLEARLKFSDVFSKSQDGIEYVVPLETRRKDLLPVPLQPIRSVRLIVPMGYDIQPARIELVGVPDDIKERVQKRFADVIEGNRGTSLTAALNILSARLHLWASEEKEDIKKKIEAIETETATEKIAGEKNEVVEGEKMSKNSLPNKSHIKVIPRPPEWSLPQGDESDDDDFCGAEESSGEDQEGQDKAAAADDVHHSVQERGTSLSCPGVQMSGIELLEVLTLNVNIKCARCKTEKEILNLKGTPSGTAPKPQAFLCDQCSATMGIGFRKDFIHQNSHRLGFFDLDGCTVTEILPSSFTPQCICSAPLPAPGLKDMVRGQSVSANCRECHRKMGLYIPEFKLLRITHGETLNLEKLPLKTKDKERYVVGTELPHRGRCQHYRKSTRWFRFSCCTKVYPCDKCHDDAENHPSEHANRMICGLCSREQNYRPDDCRFCGNAFLSKKLSHYWEGGKGTRDKRYA